MEKKQLELVITGALVLVLIILGGNALNKIRQRSASAPPAKTPSAIVQPVVSTLPPEEQKAIPQEKLEWARDPFSGKNYAAAEVAGIDLKLLGIIWEGKNSMAMINNGILKLGDKIGGYTLIDIKQDRVSLSDGNKTLELKLHR